MGNGKWAALLFLILAGCVQTSQNAGCGRYGEARADMPRPLGDDPLSQWVATTDAGMTGACMR